LKGTLGLRSSALTIAADGTIDLAQGGYKDVAILARLVQPPALFPNMTGRNIQLKATLDGPYGTARFDYRLTADRFAFDNTGFEVVTAVGNGRLSRPPVLVPVRFKAARVTGVGDVAGGILRNLTVEGVLKVTATEITGNQLRLRSDKLNGTVL